MSDPTRQSDAWEDVSAGTLQQIAAREKAAAQRVSRRRSTFGAAASLLVAVGVVVTAGLASGQAAAPIKCKDCHQRFSEFRDHVTGDREEMDPRIVRGMKRHLKKCGRCRKKFRELFPHCPLSRKSSCGPKPSCEPAPPCGPKASCGERSSCSAKPDLSAKRDCGECDPCSGHGA